MVKWREIHYFFFFKEDICEIIEKFEKILTIAFTKKILSG